MSTLYIIRGLPGSGKSTFAKNLFQKGVVEAYYEADMFMLNENFEYKFRPEKLDYCHTMCQIQVRNSMIMGLSVAVSNTTTTEKEMQPYLDLAEQYGYTVVSIVVENRHGNKSVHDVPLDKIEQMRNRFSIIL